MELCASGPAEVPSGSRLLPLLALTLSQALSWRKLLANEIDPMPLNFGK